MPADPPVVYLLYGEDDFTISQYLKELEGKLGDPTNAILNINRLDGAKCTLDELRTAVRAVPFMSKRRLVIVTQPLSRINSPESQIEYVKLLDEVPKTTALVLIESRFLKEGHWLIQWAKGAKKKAYLRSFSTPKGGNMVRWIQENVEQKGGNITRQAAFLLSGYVGEDLWLASHEIHKLISYTNKERVIDEDDVSFVALSIPQGDIFDLVDAMGTLNIRLAMSKLRILLEDQDPSYVFLMVMRQIRLVLLAKEIILQGGSQKEVAKKLQLHPYVAGKVSEQALNFSKESLEKSYKKLLLIDQRIKLSQVELDVALESFVAGLSL